MSGPRFRVSWSIPAPVILAIIAQAAVIGWVGARQISAIEGTIRVLEARLATVEANLANNALISERVKGVEVNVEVLKAQSHNIEGKIDKLIERGMR